MKKTSWIFALSLIATLAIASGCTVNYYERPRTDQGAAYTDQAYQDTTEEDYYQDFQDLSYWGQWFELAPFGYVWRPTVVLSWSPYTYGHWIWSEYGWTWVSYEPFGWATYHYGYWTYDVVWGWVWIPDYTWHPARVDWITFGDYVGWAPLPPPGRHLGHPWDNSGTPIWHVVRYKDFNQSEVGNYNVPATEYKRAHQRSEVKYKAPQREIIERDTHRQITPVKIALEPTGRRARLRKISLPEGEAQRVSKYKATVERQIQPEGFQPPPQQRENPVENQGQRGEREKVNGQDQRGGQGTRGEKPKPPETKQPEKPAKQQPEKPAKQQPEKPAKQQPEKPAKQQPERPAKKKPEKPAKQQPEKPAKQQPEKPVKERPAKEKPAKEQPQRGGRDKGSGRG